MEKYVVTRNIVRNEDVEANRNKGLSSMKTALQGSNPNEKNHFSQQLQAPRNRREALILLGFCFVRMEIMMEAFTFTK